MTAPTLYGQAESEKRADENNVCRQIVREINNFGISQRQALLVIHLLASELENVEHMRAITRLVRELGGGDLFLIGAPEPDKEVEGGNDGTPNV
jgi:hypothetical protein